MKTIKKLLGKPNKLILVVLLILILPNGLMNTSHADITNTKLNNTSSQTSTNTTTNLPIDNQPNRISLDNMPAPNSKTVGLSTGRGTDFTYSFFDPILQTTLNILVINGTSFHIEVYNTLDMHNNQITNGVVLQEASSQTSDLNAILNIPIPNHQCTTYFNIGDNTFRYVCNANGIAHELSKG